MKHINFLKIFVLSAIILMVSSAILTAQTPWDVPADKAQIKNPLKSGTELIAAGQELYIKNCKSCHGDLGENNPVKLTPQPKDLSDDYIQNQTDGMLFYKITNGRGLMPAFATKLTDKERWNLLIYLRSLNLPQNATLILTDVKITLKADTAKNMIEAAITGKNDKGEVVALAGAETALFVKRYFGDLQVDEKKRTNDKGIARFNFQRDIPGDSTGNIVITLKLTGKAYKNVSQSETLKIGVPTIAKNILDGGHMWGNRLHAPWWIVLLYLGVTGGVWITIFYVLFLVMKIKKAGKNN